MKKTLLLMTLGLASMAGMAEEKNVTLTEAGTLSAQITASEKYAITALTVAGPLNGADIALIRDMAGCDEEGEATDGQLQVLDLSDATIVSGGVYYTDMQSTKEYEAEANTVGEYMFRNLILTEVTLPATVTAIGHRAFYNCPLLTTVGGTANVATLGTAAFESCVSLTGFTFSDALTEIPDELFMRCSKLADVTLPAGIVRLGQDSFYGCNLSGLTLNDGLQVIGSGALSYTDITSLTLPASVRELESSALYSCSDLAELTLNDGLTTIGNNALAYNKAITKYVIPSTVTTIGESAFGNCYQLQEVVLPEGIETIPAYCFDRCGELTTVNIPSTVTLIDENAFQNCTNLTGVVLPEGLVELGERAFVTCESITELVLPSTLRIIGSEALSETGISEIVIPEGVTRLGGEGSMWMPGGSVFAWCPNLAKVELPSTIEALGTWSFSACPLEQLTIHAVTPPDITSFTNNPFDDNHYETCTVIVPAGALATYQEDEGWCQFTNIKEDDTTTGIETKAVNVAAEDGQIFDLQGRKLKNGSSLKGIYILNGKKTVIK